MRIRSPARAVNHASSAVAVSSVAPVPKAGEAATTPAAAPAAPTSRANESVRALIFSGRMSAGLGGGALDGRLPSVARHLVDRAEHAGRQPFELGGVDPRRELGRPAPGAIGIRHRSSSSAPRAYSCADGARRRSCRASDDRCAGAVRDRRDVHAQRRPRLAVLRGRARARDAHRRHPPRGDGDVRRRGLRQAHTQDRASQCSPPDRA